MRASGSPRMAVWQAQVVHTPVDLGWNGTAYFAPILSNVFPTVGYAMWSIYIQVTPAGNSSLDLIIRDEDNTFDLCLINITALLTAGAVRHYTFGSPGTTVPCVSWWARLQVSAGAGGLVTARVFGRGSA